MASAATCKCSNLYEDPRILPCLHTFCFKCLLKASEVQGSKDSLKCPTCDEKVVLPEGGIDHFPLDLYKAHEAEVANYGKQLETGKEACGVCFRSGSGPAIAFCVNCCDFLCKLCEEHHHSGRKTYKHEIVTVGSTLKEEDSKQGALSGRFHEQPMPCPIHDDEVLKFYCEQCEKLICRDCMELEHNVHRSRCNRVEGIAAKAMESLKSNAVECQGVLASLNDSISQCKETIQQVKVKKEEVDGTIVKILNQIRDALLAQSEEIRLGKITSLKMQVCELEQVHNDISHVCDKIKEAESYTPSQQLSTKKVFTERLVHVLQRYNTVSSVPVETSLFFTRLPDQDIIGQIIAITQILGGCDPASSTCGVSYLPRVVVGKERMTKVINIARYKDGKSFPFGHETVTAEFRLVGSTASIDRTVATDHGDGTYSLSLTAHLAGKHELQVKIGGHPIRGSPFMLTARQPRKTPYDALSSQKAISTNKGPWDVAFTEDGMLAVAEYSYHTVSLYCVVDGMRIHKFGSSETCGSGDNRFIYPSGVAISGSVMYITENYNHQVKKIRLSDKSTIGKYGCNGKGDGQFSFPRGICIDPEGRLFIADHGNNRIQVLQPDGTFAYAITGDPHNKESTFSSPWGIAFDPQGHLHIAANGSNSIKVYTPEGAYVKSYGGDTVKQPAGIAIDEEGYVAISEYGNNNSVWIYNPDHTEPPVNTIRNFSYPAGITCDAEGRFWIADSSNDRILQY